MEGELDMDELLEQEDQQSRVVDILKRELDELRHKREEFLQLVVQLQRKGSNPVDLKIVRSRFYWFLFNFVIQQDSNFDGRI